MEMSGESNSLSFSRLALAIATGLILVSCSSESKTAPYLKQICNDWQTAGYSSGSIETRENLTNKFSAQVTSAVALDPEAAADFQVAINLMKNVTVLENQEAEYSARAFFEGSQYWKDLAASRASEARSEKAKVVEQFIQICKKF